MQTGGSVSHIHITEMYHMGATAVISFIAHTPIFVSPVWHIGLCCSAQLNKLTNRLIRIRVPVLCALPALTKRCKHLERELDFFFQEMMERLEDFLWWEFLNNSNNIPLFSVCMSDQFSANNTVTDQLWCLVLFVLYYFLIPLWTRIASCIFNICWLTTWLINNFVIFIYIAFFNRIKHFNELWGWWPSY